jgi:hypothetical protein
MGEATYVLWLVRLRLRRLTSGPYRTLLELSGVGGRAEEIGANADVLFLMSEIGVRPQWVAS